MKSVQSLQQLPGDSQTTAELKALSSKLASKSQLNHLNRGQSGYIGAFGYGGGQNVLSNGSVAIFNYVNEKEAAEGVVGHWVCIDNRAPNIIYFLDPYGLEPDSPRDLLHLVNTHFFSNLLNNSKGAKQISINKKQYQDFIQYDESCGVWCSIFVWKPIWQGYTLYDLPHPSAIKDLEIEEAFLKHVGGSSSAMGGSLATWFSKKFNGVSDSYIFHKAMKVFYPQYKKSFETSDKFQQNMDEFGGWHIVGAKVANSKLQVLEKNQWLGDKVRDYLKGDMPHHSSLLLRLRDPTTGAERNVRYEKHERLQLIPDADETNDPYLYATREVQLHRHDIQLRQMYRNAEQRHLADGVHMHQYNLANSNCQVFAKNNLESVGIDVPPELEKFIVDESTEHVKKHWWISMPMAVVNNVSAFHKRLYGGSLFEA